MWKHYVERVGEPTEDIFVRIYSADYVTMKYDKQKELKPFMHVGMDAWRLPDQDVMIEKHKLFEYGVFVVADKVHDAIDRGKAVRKKNLFIVTPAKHNAFFVANHFSFLINKGSSMPLHFHRTSYVPYDGHLTGRQGATVHMLNHLPETFVLPSTATEFQRSDMLVEGLKGFATPIYDILTRAWRFPNEVRSLTLTKHNPQTGGSRRRHRQQRLTNLGFDYMFRILPIHKILVFGIKRRIENIELFDVTVIVRDRLHHAPNHSDFAFVLEMTGADMHDDERLELEIARCMHNKSWDDFVDIKEP